MDFGIPTKSLYTMGTGLAIVVGAFLLFAWVLRRSGAGEWVVACFRPMQ